MPGFWTDNIQTLKGIGPRTAAKLLQLGIETVGDLLEHYPRHYEIRRYIPSIDQLKAGELVIFRGKVIKIRETKPRRNLNILTITVQDRTGSARLVWFNQPYLKTRFTLGTELLVSGKITEKSGIIQAERELSHPDVEPAAATLDPLDETRIPIYSLCAGISQLQLRNLITEALSHCPLIADPLPASLREKYDLPSRFQAIIQLHRPETEGKITVARHRLAFEELYFLQYALLSIKNQTVATDGIRYDPDGSQVKNLESNLPFQLTADQSRVLAEIKQDMESERPMQRLLQGDVGSGKTIVAAIALVKATESGYQSALMAPTEILAEQHFSTLEALLTHSGIRLALLTGKLPAKQRRERLAAIAAGHVDIVIGTHALIQESVVFAKLGMVVADEQHRFGVRQRATLQEKGHCPDVLIMTATPIPRTMALTVYGDLDVSIIRQLPPARKPVSTYTRTGKDRSRIYEFITKQLNDGRQAYVVCPLVDESEQIVAQSATQLFYELSTVHFSHLRCGLIHGQLKGEDKEAVMNAFYAGDIQLLIATTVIEVGVNVPNATVMVVENADRFGLAQLHQLRGRVGRGKHQSYCILVSDSPREETRQRLHIMTEINDGFDLAEKDLLLRGPGHFFGSLQHGLPELKIADLLQDTQILLTARQAAQETLDSSSSETLPPGMPTYLNNILSQALIR